MKNSINRVQSQTGLNSAECENFRLKGRFITIIVDDNSYERMVKGLRVEGTVGYDPIIKIGNLNAFNRKSREPGYEKPKEKILCESASGWLKMSIKKFKMYVSANNGLGRKRAADELMRQAEELINHLRFSKSIDEILDEV